MNNYQETQLAALGDKTRRAILMRLRQGPLSVGEISQAFPMSRPAISQHLRVLKQAHLVTDSAAGTRRLYRLDREGVDSLRAFFDQFWDTALDQFARAAEGDRS
mgnify:CR=1 FL=1